MGNPVQDLFNKITKPTTETTTKTTAKTAARKTTVAGKTSVAGTTSKAKVSGKASAGAKVSIPSTKAQTAVSTLQKQKEAIALKTNQDIINAAYKVADQLKLPGGPWPLLRAAGWGHLTDDRGSRYKGPAIDEIDALTAEQKVALKKILGL
jgi:hypothetical protein